MRSFPRCIMEFNHVFEYSLFAFFAWDMLSVSSLLVTIQFELVEDMFHCKEIQTPKLYPILSNLYEVVLLIVVLIWITSIAFFTLWAWRENYQSTWWIQWWTQSMRLVFAIDWIATMLHHFLIGHTKPNKSIKLCKYYVRKRHIEKGNIDYVWKSEQIQTLQLFISIFLLRWSTRPFHILWHFDDLGHRLQTICIQINPI